MDREGNHSREEKLHPVTSHLNTADAQPELTQFAAYISFCVRLLSGVPLLIIKQQLLHIAWIVEAWHLVT